jgi:hypothetical protein
MDDPIVISLVVSGAGLLMLFLALAFLCVLIYLMTWITNGQVFTRDRPGGEGRGIRGDVGSRRWQAAVIGVALARAEQEFAGPPKTGETFTPWRALHHQRQLTLNRSTRRIR